MTIDSQTTMLDELFAPYPTHLSVEELSTLLGMTPKTAYEYLQSGELPAYKVGSRWMILRDEIKQFLVSTRNS